MAHVRIQKPLLELINRLLGQVSDLFESGPGTHGQGNVVALAAGQPALAGLHAGELLEFAVKLLNLPADAAFLFGSGRVAGLDLVGKEVVRPVGGGAGRDLAHAFGLERGRVFLASGGGSIRIQFFSHEQRKLRLLAVHFR